MVLLSDGTDGTETAQMTAQIKTGYSPRIYYSYRNKKLFCAVSAVIFRRFRRFTFFTVNFLHSKNEVKKWHDGTGTLQTAFFTANLLILLCAVSCAVSVPSVPSRAVTC